MLAYTLNPLSRKVPDLTYCRYHEKGAAYKKAAPFDGEQVTDLAGHRREAHHRRGQSLVAVDSSK